MRRFAVVVFRWNFLPALARFFAVRSCPVPVSPHQTKSAPAKGTPAKSASVKKKPAASTSAQEEAQDHVSARAPGAPGLCRLRQSSCHGAAVVAGPHSHRLCRSRSLRAPSRQRRCDAGALAWLVVGYARTLDHDYAKAIDPLNRAKAGASELGDYVAYYLGDAYLKTAHNAEALSTLADFSKDFPDSLLVRDAHLLYANALLEEGRAQEAAALLEKDRAPVRSDLEFAIGRAYEAAGDNQKAASAFRNVYFNLPNSIEADAAGAELRKLGISGSLAERRTRADLLFKAKHYAEAAHDYRDLVEEVSPANRPEVQLALAGALEKSGSSHDARKILTSMGVQNAGDAEAERLYLLSETERSTSDEEAVQRTLNELRQFGPASPWLEQALLSAGNMYLLKRDYDRAIDYFRELQQRFPNGGRASYAHWKASWLAFRQGRTDEARQGFENQIALYPDSAEIPAALYWRARLAEEEGNPAMARAFYQKLSDRFRNYYYAEFGRQRLKGLPSGGGPTEPLPHYALLDRIPPLPTAGKIAATDPPDDNLRVERARLLSNGGLVGYGGARVASRRQPGGRWNLGAAGDGARLSGHRPLSIAASRS